ncbi:MAG: membrane protein insertion efficiency factor YidD [Wenzhouxiangella sp.]|nr:MAG: membrane protein insertion efficiency factor YidD [Wenzhouxiangella sp.]
MQSILLALIRAYRYLLSPLIGRHCRFTPTCSAYAMQAIELYGAGRGSWMAAKRLLRCHPLCAGGHDPVPGYEDETPYACSDDHGEKPAS